MADPQYLNEQPSKPTTPDYLKPPSTTEKSTKHEEDIARRSGGQRVRGSGSQLGKPGDVKGGQELQELKFTEKTDTRIRLDWLRKIAYQALTQGKYPVVSMRFDKLTPPAPQDWVLIPADVYHQLKEQNDES